MPNLKPRHDPFPASLVPVVRVAAEDRLGAVELLGQERAAEQVRSSHGAEGAYRPNSHTHVSGHFDTCYVTSYNVMSDKKLQA